MIVDEKILHTYILPQVERPAQYAGGELNSVVKDWAQAPCRLAFAFPDTYEIGMSHLGERLLYEAVNNHSPHVCERVFLPLPDMARQLRQHGLPLFTLESRHALADFDLIGFTLQYELSYTNILAMLDLAGVPLTAAKRGDGQPLVIVGGPCVYNAEPLADIVDLCIIGEAEQALVAVMDAVAAAKQQQLGRRALLAQLSALPGVYVPSFYAAEYDEQGRFVALHKTADAPTALPERITKLILDDMDSAVFPAAPILPHVQPVHDRVMLEVMRGCTHGCRFCQAGMIYRPVREKSVEVLTRQAREQEAASGYDDMALLSLSTADYTQVERLMEELLCEHAPQGVGVSLPSLRVDAFSVGLAARTQEVRKSGITLAPEAGSQRLRDIINKGVTESDILTAAAAAFSQGYTHIKLYFMLGLPFETDSDVLAIAELCKKILQLGREHKPADIRKPLRLSLGVANFVPKPHTPFQWQPQATNEELRHKHDILRAAIRPLRQVTLNCHDTRTSILEAAFARGDRRLGRVLLDAYARGCLMDGWNEHFRPELWQEAFAACGLTQEQFAHSAPLFGAPLPWGHIDCGVDEAWLWQENIRAGRAELTDDCRRGACSACGVCTPARQPHHEEKLRPQPHRLSKKPAAPAQLYRYRFCLAITAPLNWLSHLDLLGAMEKSLRRSGLPVAYSQGFNPHMQISWGPAHPVGLIGRGEYVDVQFVSAPTDEWLPRLAAVLPPGLQLLTGQEVELTAPALMAELNCAQYRGELEGVTADELDAAIAAFLAATSVPLERVSPKGRKVVDVRPAVEKLWREDNAVCAQVRLDRGAAVKLPELAALLTPAATLLSAERTALLVEEADGSLRRP